MSADGNTGDPPGSGRPPPEDPAATSSTGVTRSVASRPAPSGMVPMRFPDPLGFTRDLISMQREMVEAQRAELRAGEQAEVQATERHKASVNASSRSDRWRMSIGLGAFVVLLVLIGYALRLGRETFALEVVKDWGSYVAVGIGAYQYGKGRRSGSAHDDD